jgi:glutaredoxin
MVDFVEGRFGVFFCPIRSGLPKARDMCIITGMEVRFLYFEGCPHKEPALALLKQVLRERGCAVEIEMVEIKNEDDARRYHFLGSPSVQVNGIDIEESRRNDAPVFGCRVYKTKDGYRGVFPRELIEAALDNAEGDKGKGG